MGLQPLPWERRGSLPREAQEVRAAVAGAVERLLAGPLGDGAPHQAAAARAAELLALEAMHLAQHHVAAFSPEERKAYEARPLEGHGFDACPAAGVRTAIHEAIESEGRP